MTQIRKLVIPAAGWGTRFLPTTKAVPKELLPLIEKPVIHYGVEEAVAAGIEEIIIVTSAGKDALESYFKPNHELEKFLREKGKSELIDGVDRLIEAATFRYVIQEEQLGLGHAILTAADAVGEEPFAVLLPDDVIQSHRPALKDMTGLFQEFGGSIVAVEKVPRELIPSYGIVEPEEVSPGFHRVLSMVEKPLADEAPSDLGIVGRYVFTPAIFNKIRSTRPGALGEIQITDAMAALLKEEDLYAYQFQGIRHDAGTPLGLIKASMRMALARDDLKEELRRYLTDVLNRTDA